MGARESHNICLGMILKLRTVILTRFSRVTFNAAHTYLGLTTEVLRTEKAINDIACHPLPASFYEGGGLEHLRHRFDKRISDDMPDHADLDYFTPNPSNLLSPEPTHVRSDSITDSPQMRDSPAMLRSYSSRLLVQAGDLHSTIGHPETYRPAGRSYSYTSLSNKNTTRTGHVIDTAIEEGPALPEDDFVLRDEVMSCIAKSIGLLQPPLSGDESIEASPAFSPSEAGQIHRPGLFSSSFGSLSLLETADDTSSMTGGSSAISGNGPLSALDNEVEILFFSAGSSLARAGESHGGTHLFHLANGLLRNTGRFILRY